MKLKEMCHRGFTRCRLENELQLTRKWTRKLSEIEFGIHLRSNKLHFSPPESSLGIFISYVVWDFTEVLNGVLKELSTGLGDSLTFHPGSIFFTGTGHRGRSDRGCETGGIYLHFLGFTFCLMHKKWTSVKSSIVKIYIINFRKT